MVLCFMKFDMGDEDSVASELNYDARLFSSEREKEREIANKNPIKAEWINASTIHPNIVLQIALIRITLTMLSSSCDKNKLKTKR